LKSVEAGLNTVLLPVGLTRKYPVAMQDLGFMQRNVMNVVGILGTPMAFFGCMQTMPYHRRACILDQEIHGLPVC
jgi:hypothetical protein